MADSKKPKKESLMEQIQKDVNDISNNTKSFGTKLPSGEDPAKKTDKQDEITYVDFVVGSLAQILMGKKNATLSDLGKVLSVDGNSDKSIFGKVNKIYLYLNPSTKEFEQRITTSANIIYKCIKDKKLLDDKHGFKVYDAALIEALSKNSNGSAASATKRIELIIATGDGKQFNAEGVKNLTESLDNFYNIIENYSNIDPSKIQEKLENVNKVIDAMIGDDKPLTKIMTTLSGINNSGKNVSTNLKNTFGIISDLSNIINNLENIKINNADKNIKKLTKIIVGKNNEGGSIKILINHLKDLMITDQKNIEKSTEILQSFINTITAIVDISPFKIIKGKLSVMLINTLLFNSIKEIIENLTKLEGIIISDETKETFKVFNSFIDSILKLTEVDIKSKKQFEKNVKFIETKIINRIVDLIKNISYTLKEVSIDGKKAIEPTFNIIDEILKLKDYKEEEFDQIFSNIDDLKIIVEEDLKELLNCISNVFDKTKNDAIIQNLESTDDVFNNFNNLFDNFIGIKKHFIYSFQLNMMLNEIALIDSIIKSLKKIDTTQINEKLVSIKQLVDDFVEITKNASNINKGIYESVDAIIKFIKKINVLNKLAGSAKLGNIAMEAIKEHVDSMIAIINSFKDVNPKDIKKADDTVNTLMKIVISSALILIIGAVVMTFIKVKNLIAFGIALSILLYSVVGIFSLLSDKLQKSLTSAKDATLLIIAAGTILVLGGLIMNYVDIGNLLVFTVALSVFLLTVGGIFLLFHKGFEHAMEGAEDAALLIAVAGLTLVVGGMFMKMIDIDDLFKFILTLSVFLFAIGGVFLLFHAGFENAMEGAKDAALLVAVSGLTLVVGSLFMKIINVNDLIAFGVILALFVGGILIFYGIASRLANEALEGAEEVAVLVAVSGLTLIIGALFMKIIDVGALLEFAAILVGFVSIILLTYGLAAKLARRALRGAKEVAVLVAVSAITLIFGAWLIQKKIIDPLYLGIFAFILGAFIGALLWIYGKAARNIRRALPGLIGVALVTVLSAGILLFAGYLIKKDPDLLGNITLFGIVLLAFIAGMSTVSYFLGNKKFAMRILAGEGLLLGIIALIGLAAVAIRMVANTAKSKDFMDNVIAGGEAIFSFIGITAAAAGVLGAIAYTGVGAIILGAGMAIIAGLLALIYGAAKVVDAVAESMKKINSVEKLNPDKIFDNIKTYIGIVDELMPLANLKTAAKLKAVSWSIGALGNVLESMAKGIKSWANLTIPIYKGTKIVGYETIDKDAFTKAAKNIKTVITTLAGAVLDVYNGNVSDDPRAKEIAKELFGFEFKSFITGSGNSKFSRVAKSIGSLGKMLTNIASGIKTWVNLKIPIYSGTKITGYVNIEKDDFTRAAKNIKTVITTLASAVLDVYNAKDPAGKELAKELFDNFEFGSFITGTGNSKFSKIANSLRKLGKLLSSIASGIKTWVSLKIPEYKNGAKEPSGYITLTSKEFGDAGEHIKQVVKCLATALIEAVGENPELFSTDEKANGVIKAAAAVNMVSYALAPIAKTVANYASGNFQILTLNKDGKWVGGETIKLDKSKYTALENNIRKVITALGSAIVKVYEENKKLGIFETVDRGFGGVVKKDSPMVVVANSINSIAGALNQIIDVIGKFVESDTIKKIINNLGDEKSGLVADIETIMSKVLTIGSIIGNDNHKHMYWRNGQKYVIKEDLSKWLKIITDVAEENVEKISNIINMFNNVLENTADIVKTYDKYKKDIDKFLNIKNNENLILTQFQQTISVLLSIVSSCVTDVSNLDWLIDNEDKLIDSFNSSSRIINNLFENIVEINKQFDKVGNIKVNEIKKSMQDIKSIIDEFDDLFNMNKTIESKASSLSLNIAGFTLGGVSLRNTKNNLRSLEDEYSLIQKKLNLIINISKKTIQLGELQSSFGIDQYENIFYGISLLYKSIMNSENVTMVQIRRLSLIKNVIRQLLNDVYDAPPFELFKILADGIEYIYSVTAKIQSIANFKTHTEWLQKYIKSINELNEINLSSLIEFVTAVDKLSQRLGDLDKLTDAIGNKLAAVLYELVNELHKADVSINNAHKLQEKRKQLIQESLDKVRGLMSQHMIVEISQTSTDMGGGAYGGGDGSVSGGTTDGSPQSTETNLAIPGGVNPENANVPKNGSTQNIYNTNNDSASAPLPPDNKSFNKLTVGEFKNLCIKTFKEHLLK